MGLNPCVEIYTLFQPFPYNKEQSVQYFFILFPTLVSQYPPLGGRGPGPVWAGGGGQGGHRGGQRGLQVSYVAPILQ